MWQLIYRTAYSFQDLTLKDRQLQLIYFMIKTLFSVPIIASIGLVKSQLFQANNTKQLLQQSLDEIMLFNSFYENIACGVAILIFLITHWIVFKTSNEKYYKLAILVYMFFQISNSLISTCLICIITSVYSTFKEIIAPIIFIVLLQISNFLLQKIWISYSFITQNDYSHKGNTWLYLFNFVERLIFLFTFYQGQTVQLSSGLNQTFFFIIVVIYSLRLKSYLENKYYLNQTSQNFENMRCVISIVQCTIIFLYEIYPQISIKDNFFQLSIVICVFACISVYSYTSFKKNDYFFKSIEQIEQNKQTVNYLESIYQLASRETTVQMELIISGLKKNHIFLCKKSKCYCSEVINLEQKQFNIQLSNSIFLKGFYQDTLNAIQSDIKDNKSLVLKLLFFKFEIFKNFITISRQMNKPSFKDSQTLDIKIGKKLLQYKITKFVEQKNKTDGNLSIQSPLVLNKTLNNMQEIIFSDIHLKSQKWKSLKRGMCKTQDIQKGVVIQIQNLRNFQLIYAQFSKSFQKSVAFNALCMFYFGEIVFFPRQIQILIFNLKRLEMPLRSTQILTNKDMAKVMLDYRFCLLEFQISKYQNLSSMDVLKISNFNDNVMKVFKYQKKQLINEKIKIIFPKMLWQHQQVLLKKFLNEEDQDLYKDAVDKYYIDKQGFVFSGLTTFKIVPKSEGISLIILIFQKQVNNVVLLDSNGLIQNIGPVYTKIFGNIHLGIPLHALFYNINDLKLRNFRQIEQKKKLQLINGSHIGPRWTNFLINIDNYMKLSLGGNTKSFEVNQISKQSKQYEHFQLQLFNYLNDQRNKLIQNNKICHVEQNMEVKFKFPIVQIDFLSKQCSINNFKYNVIILKQVLEKYLFIEDQNTSIKKSIRKRKPVIDHQKLLTMIPQEAFEMLSNSRQQIINMQKQRKQQTALKKKKQLKDNRMSHIQSSVTRVQSVSYFYQKFIETCFDLFKNPNAISDIRLNFFTFSSIFISTLLSLLIIFTYVLFDLGFYEIKDIFFADGAVSDNMQLSQFLYNRAMNIVQFKDDPAQLSIIIQSANYQRQVLYSLTSADLGNYLSVVTSMTSTKFYGYITEPVKWHFVDPQTPIQQIQTNQFLEYYYYLSIQVEENVLNPSIQAQKTLSNALSLMKINFPELKRINHGFLYLYKDMSDYSMNLLSNFVLILGFGHLFLSIVVLMIFTKQKYFRRSQQIQTLSIYQIIPHRIIEIMSNHYSKFSNIIKSENDLHQYQSHIALTNLQLPNDKQTYSRQGKSTIIPHRAVLPFSVYKMLAIIIALNIMFLTVLIQINSLFIPFDNMLTNVNDLMDSQNYLLESYFDLKAQFIIDGNYTVAPQFFDSLLKSQLSSDTIFARLSVDSLELFSKYDPTYKTDFITLLIDNNCELDKQLVSPQLYQKCVTYFKYRMMNNGVLTAMNYMARKVRNVILELKQKILLNTAKSQDVIQRLKRLDLREIDQSIIFMFRMYQGTQARIYTSLGNVIVDLFGQIIIIIVIQVLSITVFYTIFLYFNFKNEKLSLSKLYLSFVLVPTPISKMIKTFTVKIQEILEYNRQT